jgi:hypothetical protein
MKSFIYKTAVLVIAVILIYEFTIGKQIKQFKVQTNSFLTKEGRKDRVQKIREEIKKAVKKERYLSKEDAQLINQFLNKIRSELNEAEK